MTPSTVGLPTSLRSGASVATVLGVGGVGLAAGLLAIGGPSIALAALVAFVGILGVAFLPGAVFAAYLLIPFYKGAVQPLLPLDLTVILALVNVMQVVPLLARRRFAIPAVGVALWTALAILITGGALYAPDERLAASHVIAWWTLVYLPILAGAARVGSEERYVGQLLWTFFGLGVLVVLLGLPQISRAERLEVLGSNTIAVGRAAMLVPILGVAFAWRAHVRGIRPALVLLMTGAFVVALASGSRGPLFVALAIGVVVLVWRGIRSPLYPAVVARAAIVLGSVVIAVAFALQFLPSTATDRFALFGDFVQSAINGTAVGAAGDTSSAARVSLFGAAVEMFQQRPILGFGTAGFESTSPTILGPLDADRYPHNALLQFAAEFGVVGVVLFLALITLAFAQRLAPRLSTSARALLVFFLVSAMLSGDIFDDRLTWGLLMIMLLATGARRAAPRQIPALRSTPVAAPA